MTAQPNPLDRYRARAAEIAADFSAPRAADDDDRLTLAIAELVHAFVEHDMEWAALAVESADASLAFVLRAMPRPERLDVHARMLTLAESLRARGRGVML